VSSQDDIDTLENDLNWTELYQCHC